MFGIIQFLKLKFSPPQYRLEGKCKMCGKCCRYLYSLDDYTALDFKITQFLFPKYRRFKIRGKDESGNLVLECTWIQDDNTCKYYDKRLDLCKNFPNVKYGSLGAVPEGCGFKLVPINKFDDVLTGVNKKKKTFAFK